MWSLDIDPNVINLWDPSDTANSKKEYDFVAENKYSDRKRKVKKKLEDIIQPIELRKYTRESNAFDYEAIQVKKKAVYSFQDDYGSKIERKISIKAMRIPAINQKKLDTFTRPGVGRIKPLPRIKPPLRITPVPVDNSSLNTHSLNAQRVIDNFEKSWEESKAESIEKSRTKSIKESRKMNLPPRPYSKQISKISNRPPDKHQEELKAVKRGSILRHGSYLPKKNVTILDLSSRGKSDPINNQNLSKTKQVVNSTQAEEVLKSQHLLLKPKTIASSLMKDKTVMSSSYKQSQSSAEDSDNEHCSGNLPELNHKELASEEDQSITTYSVGERSCLKLKTGLVDSPFVTNSQNTLLKLWRKSKLKSAKRQIKKHMKALILHQK
jgi:hypothetical protein